MTLVCVALTSVENNSRTELMSQETAYTLSCHTLYYLDRLRLLRVIFLVLATASILMVVFWDMMTEAVCISETSIYFYETTRC
jgi:hypothetical protein